MSKCTKKPCWMKMGAKAKVIGNRAGHGLPVGTIVTIGQDGTASGYTSRVIGIGEPGSPYTSSYWFEWCDLESMVKSKADLEKQKAELQNEINMVQGRIDYLTEIGAEEFDETEFKCFYALKIADDKNRPLKERMKAMSDLIKNG